jgi:16S rRNA (cytidine1402-2'-O)-methyltransferase
MVFYESPYRVIKTLELFSEFLGPGRMAAVVREISKIYEECKRGTFTELIAHYTAHPPKGEIVMIISGKNYEESVDPEEPEERD